MKKRFINLLERGIQWNDVLAGEITIDNVTKGSMIYIFDLLFLCLIIFVNAFGKYVVLFPMLHMHKYVGKYYVLMF